MTTAADIMSANGNQVRLNVDVGHLENVMTRLTEAVAGANTWFSEEHLPKVEATKTAEADRQARDQAYSEELERRMDEARRPTE